MREGLSNPEIAERLEMGRETVKRHGSAILSKLGVGSRDEVARWEPEGRWWSLVGPLTAAKAAGVAVVAAALVGILKE